MKNNSFIYSFNYEIIYIILLVFVYV